MQKALLRSFAVLSALSDVGEASVDDLAHACEVSSNTMRRHLASMRAAGLVEPGKRPGSWHIPKERHIALMGLTDGEVASFAAAGWSQAWRARYGAAGSEAAAEKLGTAAPEAKFFVMRRELEKQLRRERQNLHALELAISAFRKVEVAYRKESGEETWRIVRPLFLQDAATSTLLVSWCELRSDFRVFRLDRITAIAVRNDTFLPETGRTIADYQARRAAEKTAFLTR